MKNITLHIIGQKILGEILMEQKSYIKMDVFLYKDLNEFFKNTKYNNIKSIIVVHISEFELIEKSDQKIFQPIFYLTSKIKTLNLKTKFQKYETLYFPIKFKNFINKINLIYLKSQFADNSKINISNYVINLNTREISNDKNKLKLTEREKDFLLFLKNSKKPQKIGIILAAVWGYSKGIETHTVETHVHRLRKKFFTSFNDNNFIKNNKKGYYI